MTTTAIRAQGLGKEYRIGAVKDSARYSTLRDAISTGVRSLMRRGGKGGSATNRVWALRNFDLSVNEGEVVGIIGKNGSGKSTLLKILSDIVEPSEGQAEIRGRVASLLEVGTGFHGELTGRENVYLNGAILGMRRWEVQKNFDKIVEFSGIGDYIDTPVKRYSSGMYLRLAFAVAAHLEPEVLIVDEVLAVGDFEFQQRCINRMKEVGQGGRTVLFVSHSMGAVEALCSRCVLIEKGRQVLDGLPHDVTREYRRRMTEVEEAAYALLEDVDNPLRKTRILQSAHILDEGGALSTAIAVSRAFEIRIGARIPANVREPIFIVRIDNAYGERLLTLRSPVRDSPCHNLSGEHEVSCRVDEFPLSPGVYRVGLAVFVRDNMIDSINDVLSFAVTDGELYSEGRRPPLGTCIARSQWSVGPRTMGTVDPAIPARKAQAAAFSPLLPP